MVLISHQFSLRTLLLIFNLCQFLGQKFYRKTQEPELAYNSFQTETTLVTND